MKKVFSLTSAGLIQTILMVVLFFANAYFFFVDSDMNTSIRVIQIILGIITTFGLVSLAFNKEKLSASEKLTSLEIVALVGIILFTAIATIGILSSVLF